MSAPDLGPTVSAAGVALREAVPLINGAAVPGQWRQHGSEFHWEGAGSMRVRRGEDGGIAFIEWELEQEPSHPFLSAGLRFGRLEGVTAVLRNGYTSWDGSGYVDAGSDAAPGVATGYAATQLLSDAGALVLGFDRHDRYLHRFTWDSAQRTLAIETDYDGARTAKGAQERSDRLGVLPGLAAEPSLRAWAEWVARSAPLAPRPAGRQIRGWCSWYNLYAAISEPLLRSELAQVVQARSEGLPMEVFQIDDGFTPEMGDWLETRPTFPQGMSPLLASARAAGLRPGLWIAPFMVGNRSRLYAEHPDWVVGDRKTGGPLAQMTFYGEFRWHKRSEEYYILDASHPEALQYLRRVFRTWRHGWGCEYFKTDFMHFGVDHGPDRARWHDPSLSRVQIWRRAAEAIREEIGEAFWLGCGCPLWPSIGLVDGIRIGRDVGVEWGDDDKTLGRLRDQSLRNFGHGVLWQADPDCVLLRDRFHSLSEREVRGLAIYAAMTGGVMMTSDSWAELSAGRRALWQRLLALGPGRCDCPLLGVGAWQDVIVQLRQLDSGGGWLLFVLNLGAEAARRTLTYRAWCPGGIQRVEPLDPPGPAGPATGELLVDLPRHEGAWWHLWP